MTLQVSAARKRILHPEYTHHSKPKSKKGKNFPEVEAKILDARIQNTPTAQQATNLVLTQSPGLAAPHRYSQLAFQIFPENRKRT